MTSRTFQLLFLDLPPVYVPTKRRVVSAKTQKLMLLAVEHTEGARITQDQLAEITGMSLDSARCALLVLERRGLIRSSPANPDDLRYTDRCKGVVNRYHVVWSAVAAHAKVDTERSRCNKTARGHREPARHDRGAAA